MQIPYIMKECSWRLNAKVQACNKRGAGGARAPPLFGGSVNPISTRGGTLSPPSTMCPPDFWPLLHAWSEVLLKYCLETFQDFLIQLDIKLPMHLLEMSIFSQNDDLVRLNKIMNNLVKDLKILRFKVIFQCLKLGESFQKKISVKNIWLGDQLILMKFF